MQRNHSTVLSHGRMPMMFLAQKHFSGFLVSGKQLHHGAFKGNEWEGLVEGSHLGLGDKKSWNCLQLRHSLKQASVMWVALIMWVVLVRSTVSGLSLVLWCVLRENLGKWGELSEEELWPEQNCLQKLHITQSQHLFSNHCTCHIPTPDTCPPVEKI